MDADKDNIYEVTVVASDGVKMAERAVTVKITDSDGKWSLSGDDAARFQLTGADDNVRTLEFREKADFEIPMDADKDNITHLRGDGGGLRRGKDGGACRDRQDNRQR